MQPFIIAGLYDIENFKAWLQRPNAVTYRLIVSTLSEAFSKIVKPHLQTFRKAIHGIEGQRPMKDSDGKQRVMVQFLDTHPAIAAFLEAELPTVRVVILMMKT